MENPDNIKELLEMEAMERYLQGTMTGKELSNYEDRLAKDKDFAEEVALFKDLGQSIQLNGDKDLKAAIGKAHQSLEQENFFQQETTSAKATTISKQKKLEVSHKRFNIGRILGVAAGVAVLVGAALFLFQQPSHVTPQEQFAEVFKPETTKLDDILDDLESYGLADPDAERKEELASALGLYEKGEYEQARKLLVAHLDRFKEDNIGRFYLGLCLLQEGEYAKAATHLQPLIQDENFELLDESRWYLSLCYMMFDTPTGKENAKKLISQILADSNTQYKVEAQYNLDYLNE